MKTLKTITCCFALCLMLSSCGLFGKARNGCPSNGANVGAEKILGGDPKATKDIKKGKKYKMGKSFEG